MAHSRPETDDYFLAMARLVSYRATCTRRAVGCILVDKHKHVLATGYNGVAAGEPHCIDVPCSGAELPSGTGLDKCEAIHAEQNAILQCSNVRDIETAYITVSPCITCTKLLMNTGCKRIVFIAAYTDESPKKLWKGEWIEHGPIKYVPAESRLETADKAAGPVISQHNKPGRGNVGSAFIDKWTRRRKT